MVNTNLNFDNETNASTLQATRDIQAQSLEALRRIQNQAAETQAIGTETLTQLHQQDARIDNIQRDTDNLNETLKKTKKLQDRFAFLSMNFGNKKTAKEHVKADKKTQALLNSADPPTFKRRGPRPKKNKGAGGEEEEEETAIVPSTPEEILRQSKKASQEMAVEVERSELFSGRKVDKKKSRKGGRSSKSGGGHSGREEQPLTDEDQRQLDAIKADDAAVDAGLDILGNQVESLMMLSKQMGETTSGQNTKIDNVQGGLSKVNDRTQTANQRSKLFMMNRRQKRKENDNKLGLGNPVTAAVKQTFK